MNTKGFTIDTSPGVQGHNRSLSKSFSSSLLNDFVVDSPTLVSSHQDFSKLIDSEVENNISEMEKDLNRGVETPTTDGYSLFSNENSSYSQFFSKDFSSSNYLHHILQSFALSRTSNDSKETAIQNLENNSQISHNLTISALQKLNAALNYVFEEIKNELKTNWSFIVDRIHQIDELKQCQNELKKEFEEIQKLSMTGIFTEDLFSRIEKNIEETKRLHSVVILLRLISIMYDSMKDIEDQQLISTDSVTCAKKISQIISLYETRKDLHGIQIVHSIVSKAKSLSETLKRNASSQLSHGLKSSQDELVTKSIEVLLEIHQLGSEITNILSQAIHSTNSILQTSLDTSKYSQIVNALNSYKPVSSLNSASTGKSVKSGSTLTNLGPSGQKAIVEFFKEFQDSLTQIYSIYEEIWRLSNLLKKKSLHFQTDSSKTSFLESYWTSITKNITQTILGSINTDVFIRYAFVEEYPQASEIFTNFVQKFSPYTEFISQNQRSLTPNDWIKQTVKVAEQMYIESYTQRFDQALANIFSRIKMPRSQYDETFSDIKEADIDKLVIEFTNEMVKIKGNKNLLLQLSNDICHTIKQFIVRCKEFQKIDEESLIIYPFKLPGIFLKFNAHVFNSICIFYAKVSTLIIDFSSVNQSQIYLSSVLEDMKQYAQNLIVPIFRSLQIRLEEILVSIHMENYTLHTGSVSAFVTQLQKSLPFIFKEYIFLHLNNLQIITLQSKELIERFYHRLVLRLSLINPILEQGKIKLADDITQIELAIGFNVTQTDVQGKYYKQMKAFRRLLFMETNDILENKEQLLQDLDSYLIALHLFSRIPPTSNGTILRPYTNLDEYFKFLLQNSSNSIAILNALKTVVNQKLSEIENQEDTWSIEAKNILTVIQQFTKEQST